MFDDNISLYLSDLLLPENRRRLPLEEQLLYLQARFDEVSSGKHSIGRSRRAKALRKEMTVIKRKLAHQREGGVGPGGRSSGGGGDRGPSLSHHPSTGHHDEGGESSSQEISSKGESGSTWRSPFDQAKTYSHRGYDTLYNSSCIIPSHAPLQTV